jgi:hypothetical protein
MTAEVFHDNQKITIQNDMLDFLDNKGGFNTVSDEEDGTAVTFSLYANKSSEYTTLYLRQPGFELHIDDLIITRK